MFQLIKHLLIHTWSAFAYVSFGLKPLPLGSTWVICFPFCNSYDSRVIDKANASRGTSFWPSWSHLADMKSCGDDWWNETLFIAWFGLCMYVHLMWCDSMQCNPTKNECFFWRQYIQTYSNILHTFCKYIEMYQSIETCVYLVYMYLYIDNYRHIYI